MINYGPQHPEAQVSELDIQDVVTLQQALGQVALGEPSVPLQSYLLALHACVTVAHVLQVYVKDEGPKWDGAVWWDRLEDLSTDGLASQILRASLTGAVESVVIARGWLHDHGLSRTEANQYSTVH